MTNLYGDTAYPAAQDDNSAAVCLGMPRFAEAMLIPWGPKLPYIVIVILFLTLLAAYGDQNSSVGKKPVFAIAGSSWRGVFNVGPLVGPSPQMEVPTTG